MKEPFTLALVTGASSGIGEALARLIASFGINLLLTGRNQEKLALLKEELSAQVDVEVVVADLTLKEERKKVIDAIHKRSPDLCINNAGFGYYGHALNFSTMRSLNMVEVDVAALLEISLEAARAMISSGKKGVIMNIASAAAFQIFPNFAVYSASKAFVNQFSESFDEEVRGHGIRVLTSCPGIVDTHFRESAGGSSLSPKEKISAMTKEFAALEIWRQIEQRKKLHIFDWRYRLATFFTRFLLPKSLVAKVLEKNITDRSKKDI